MLNNIHSIEEIIQKYDALIFDIWGVVYEGNQPYASAIPVLNEMLRLDKKIVFLSNAPRPGSLVRERFVGWGLDINKVHIYTSGDYVREQLLSWDDDVFKALGKNFYHLGSDKNKDILHELEVNVVSDINKANFLLISLYMDEDEDLNIHDDLFKKAISLNLPAICANPDVTVYYENKLRYCSGSFAAKYSELGGLVHYYGKPNPKIFNKILSEYLSGYEHNKILMVGDTMETDIMGANSVGIDSMLVSTGNGKNAVTRISNGDQAILKNCRPTWISHGFTNNKYKMD